MKPLARPVHSSAQRGLGAIAVIVILVALAAVAASIAKLGAASSKAIANDLDSARAYQAAYAGTQWGLYQALKGSWTSCASPTQTLNMSSDYGMNVTVTCTFNTYTEGYTAAGPPNLNQTNFYTITAVACNSTTCPDNARAAQPNYEERMLQVQVASASAPLN